MLHHITNGLLTASLLAPVAVSGMTHDAPLGGWVGGEAAQTVTLDSKPVNVPAWESSYAEQFAGCAASLPSGTIPATVVVVKQTGDVSEMAFDKAWDRTHNASSADDVWVVGQCR